MEERAERLALYIIENRTTVRAAAQKFGISKSTVHTDATKKNGPSQCSWDRFFLIQPISYHTLGIWIASVLVELSALLLIYLLS